MRSTNNSASSALSGNYGPDQIAMVIEGMIGDPDTIETKKSNKKKVVKHRYYKKPGKGHNRDTCDACGDTGDIICCDSCPASFHLICLDPPLEEEKLPNGGWKCRACSMQKSRSNAKGVLPKVEKFYDDLEEPEQDTQHLFGFFKKLGEHFRKQNPKKFALPTTIPTYDPKLPGYCKPVAVTVFKKPKPRRKRKPSFTIQPTPKPLPPRTTICFLCGKSKRKGFLLQCDYCPAYFHLNCLDPPMNKPPSVYWMCPLHAQPLMEAKYLTSSALSERMRIWDLVESKTSTPFTALLNFASAVHCKTPKNPKDNQPVLPDKPKIQTLSVVEDIYEKFRGHDENSKQFELPDEPSTSGALKHKRRITPKVSENIQVEKSPVDPSVPQTGLDLLLQASDLTDDNTLDEYLKGLSPHLLKMLALSKLAEKGNITVKYQTQRDLAEEIEKQLSESNFATDSKHIAIPKKKKLEPTFTLVYLNDGKLMEFHKRSIEVGMGGTSTLDLANLGPCVSTSRRQALIYYNPVACYWEMLNYGDRGSIVNGIVYGCDTSIYDSLIPRDEALRSFKKIVSKKRAKLLDLRNPKDTFQSMCANNEGKACACLEHVETPSSCYEGSAVLRKGDQLRFGCHKFVITEMAVVEREMANGVSDDEDVNHADKIDLINEELMSDVEDMDDAMMGDVQEMNGLSMPVDDAEEAAEVVNG